MSKDIKIMVVTHKNTGMPADTSLFVPTAVGPNKDKLLYREYITDDQGYNIAEKNPNYCELTALYWAWKNLDAEYIGLVHYRRLFMEPSSKNEIVKKETLEKLFKNIDVILPKKRNYYIENTLSHYKHNHNINDLLETRQIITELYPSYVMSFDKIMKEKKSHRFNMMIMKEEKFDEYSKWLFDILFELENRIDISDYDSYQSRIYGFISERLVDVWIDANNIQYKELPVKFMEKQDWIKKGSKFIFNKIKKG